MLAPVPRRHLLTLLTAGPLLAHAQAAPDVLLQAVLLRAGSISWG